METKHLKTGKARCWMYLLLMLPLMAAKAQQNYDFSAVCSTGQTLYYKITNASTHTVELTYPRAYAGSYWYGVNRPVGNIVLPSRVAYNGIQYTVTSIGRCAFYNCSTMTGSLTIPNTVTSIGDEAFSTCSGFTGSLNIPNSVTSIGDDAFMYCGFTGSLTIPNSVSSIGNRVFYNCYYFNSLTLPNTITTIGDQAFRNCGFTGSLTIPASVTIIGSNAFEACKGFDTLIFQSSETSIGSSAFAFCTGLTSIVSKAATPPIAYGGCFNSISTTIPIHVPCGSTEAYLEVAEWCNFTNYQEQFIYTLNVSSADANLGTAAITRQPDCGTDAIVTAMPNEGCQFVNWTRESDIVSTDAVYTFTVTEDLALVANFATSSYTISASANPAVGGTVTGAGEYDHGANVTLSASANEGYTFVNWTENNVEVSTSPNYSFTATADRTLVANFSLNSYTISASANPAVGGTVSGANTYNHGANVTLTANANEGYTFVKWTENGVEVSTSPNYSFTATADRTLVANFSLNSYAISASANPAVGGTVSGANTYNHGANVTLTATANEGYTFVNWTENDVEVSTSPNYSFTATADRTFVANFVEMGGNHWIPEDSQFASYMNVLCVVNIDGVEQERTDLEIGAFCGEQCRGSKLAQQFPVTGKYIFRLAVYGNSGDNITFRLYDHQQQTELDLQSQNTLVWENNGYGGLGNPYVLYFDSSVTQTLTLANGYNWISPYIEMNGIDGLEMLEQSLGSNGEVIQNRQGLNVFYYEGYGWWGDLETITNEQMVQVKTTSTCDVELVGHLASADSHPITINEGWNWIGYPLNCEMNTVDALSSLTAETDDVIKNRLGFSAYYEGYGWYGDVEIMEPGQGYMYKQNASTPQTLTYPTNGRNINMVHVPNGTKHYGTDAYAYSGNMSVVAVAEMGGEELRSEDYELAAFVNGQCRGSVRLLDVAHLNRSLALLTIQGEAGDVVSYRLYDHQTGIVYESLPADRLEFAKDRVEGSMDNPVTIHFSTTGLEEFETAFIDIYPNPTTRNHSISLNLSGVSNINHVIIEVYNAYGQKLREVSSTQSPVNIEGFGTAGMYFIKVVTDSDQVIFGKVIVE